MQRINHHPISTAAAAAALTGRAARSVLLPELCLLAVTAIFVFSAMLVLPPSSISFTQDEALPPQTLSPDSQAYLTAEYRQPEVAAVDDNAAENYEDYDIPKSQFKSPLPSGAGSFLRSINRAAPSELNAITPSAEVLRRPFLAQSTGPQAAAEAQTPVQTPAAAETPEAQAEITALPAPAAEEEIEAAPLPRPTGTWYQHTVVRGDSMSQIFKKLALPASALTKVADAAGASDLKLYPGQILHFLTDDSGAVLELVVPLGKSGQQVRFTRLSAADSFTAVYESALAHVEDPASVKDFALSETMPTAKAAAQERAQKEAERQAAAEAAAKERALREEARLAAAAQAEPEIIEESAAPAASGGALRPRLVYGTIAPGENFAKFAQRLGLTSGEIKTITKIYAGKGKLTSLKSGDSVRVLFNSIGTSALIDAVEIDSKAWGRSAFYRNAADKNFYEEDKYVPTAGVFRRFPLAAAIKVNSKFNPHRRNPVTGRVSPHNGVDLKVPIGTPVYAPADGVVTFAGYQRAAGYYVIIRHEQNYSTVYMHLSKFDVKKGQQVTAGQVIAKSGNTGRTTGPHLHYEIRINDRPVDPLKIELPSSSRPNLAREQREAFKSNVAVFKSELYNEALAQNN